MRFGKCNVMHGMCAAFIALGVFVSASGADAQSQGRKVPPEVMKKIYEEVKTPYKHGVILMPQKGEMLDNPCVFRHNDAWYMMYISFDGKGYETRLAKSDNLLDWKPLGCILKRGKSGAWDSAQADGWPTLLDPAWEGPNTLKKFNNRYWMMYLGGNKNGYETDPLSTGVAWTDDPTSVKEWTRYEKNPVLSPNDPDAREFETKTIYKHYTVEDSTRSLGGRFVNFYNAKQKGVWREQIGVAVSDDLLAWKRVGTKPVIENGVPGKAALSADPMIKRIGDVWVMFYFGFLWRDDVKGAFDTFACSYDLKEWTKWDGEPLVKPSEPYDSVHAHKPWVIKHNGIVYHYYCAVGDKGRCIALSMSKKPEAQGHVKDTIKNGTHGYTPKGYVTPKEPEVRERLEWFKDQKLALMMHWGLYSTIGIRESWPLSDADAKWSRDNVDWTKDAEEFKRQYIGLIKSFNPVCFEPEKWAKAAKEGGFRYLIFGTKHHDGFCLFDSKYSDFKTTSKECPFSSNPRSNIVRHVFDAFRAQGLGIGAYFSKPDWHNNDYWENFGLGRYTNRMPTYDVKKNPEKWNNFAQYTRNQIVELVRDYGKIDIIWLDGGQVQRRCGLDINIESIIAEARKHNPSLISVDRTAGGSCENVITPEQTIPRNPIAVPWESCITMTDRWSFHFNEIYKSKRAIIHMLIDIVAKGGNLALNVGPQPDGHLPQQALERMRELGKWLGKNGEAIYDTRPLPPFREGDWAYTWNRKTNTDYAIRLWKESEKNSTRQILKGVVAKKVRHVGSNLEFNCETTADGSVFNLPKDFSADAYADVFVIIK